MPEIELVGDVYAILLRLAQECRDCPASGGSPRLRHAVDGILDAASGADSFPALPPRALLEIRDAMGREDILVSDVGLHKLWIGRAFPTFEPNTVLIANGLAGMGFAVPAAIAAKLVHPNRKVVAVSGDGGFLMNSQELETAMRLRTAFVNVIWENKQYGSIVWKQENRFGRHFGTDFENPDFVKLAESFGMPAWRCESIDDYRERLRAALELDVPSLIALPIDYSMDVAIATELGTETTRI
jgi:acetolactate synthase-1/2/3 large subunit